MPRKATPRKRKPVTTTSVAIPEEPSIDPIKVDMPRAQERAVEEAFGDYWK